MFFCLLGFATASSCPFSASSSVTGHNTRLKERVAPTGYLDAFADIDFAEVKADLTTLMTTSQEWWPADYGHYGPLMIRNAWHAAGSYRQSDGRGGADGGRMRFDPERSWDDNTNLDKARKLLEPIKQKYGVGLSWGDLIVLAGDTAIESMGLPTLGFCGGRIDDVDGFWSERLGPNAEQEEAEPCLDPGACTHPFGSNQVGLIYVNPQGPKGVPDPDASAVQVRSTFGRMGMNDIETVALIGGGHAFGKMHGPAGGCGPGLKPSEDPLNSWVGTCGSGKGVDTFTSGFEGPWTSLPTTWDNEYFSNLLDYSWESYEIDSGATQWRVDGESPTAPFANSTGQQTITMTTADLSLTSDSVYLDIVQDFANDQSLLDQEFSKAWYKLMSRDMGPVSRCLGDLLPTEPQDFQASLETGSTDSLPDFDAVREKLVSMLTTPSPVTPLVDGTYGPLMVRLAWRSAATFRVTDYQGGANGARIRGEPQISWTVNAGLDKALELLQPIKDEFEDLTWADLIVLAGNTALEEAGSPELPFCGGRVDFDFSEEDVVSPALEYLNSENIVLGNFNSSLDDLEQYALLLNLNDREYTALMGGLALGRLDLVPGFSGERTMDTTKLNNAFFENLLTETWAPNVGETHYEAAVKDLQMLRSDMLLVARPETLTAVQDYAGDNDLFLADFGAAWTKMMNADRFDGPTGNVCDAVSASSDPDTLDGTSGSESRVWTVLTILLLIIVIFLLGAMAYRNRLDKSSDEKAKSEAELAGLPRCTLPAQQCSNDQADPKAEII